MCRFKIWDSYEEIFIDEENIAINSLGTIFETDGDMVNVIGKIGDGRYILCKSTDVNDKNGLEVHHRDIVAWVQAQGGIIEPDCTPKICEVIWESNGWHVIDRAAEKKGLFGRYTFASCHIEIIGNIYENPELLEDHNELLTNR